MAIPGKWTVRTKYDHLAKKWHCFISKGASCVSIGQATSRAGAWKEAHFRAQDILGDGILGSYIRPGQAGHACVGVCCKKAG